MIEPESVPEGFAVHTIKYEGYDSQHKIYYKKRFATTVRGDDVAEKVLQACAAVLKFEKEGLFS